MKYFFLSIFSLFIITSKAAPPNWAAYNLYTFNLPYNLGANIQATIFYKGKPLVPKTITVGKQKININNTFTYTALPASIVNKINIPITLPANTFAWLCTSDIVIEMTTKPGHFKIKISSLNDSINANYQLPEKFDFISENAINIDYAKNLSAEQLKNIYTQKIYTLSITPKKIAATKPISNQATINSSITDTTLYYSLTGNNKIPAAFTQNYYNKLYNTNATTTQQFTIEKAFLYNAKIFVYINPSPQKNTKPTPPIPDGMTYTLMDLNATKCATSGGITGRGAGGCAGMNMSKNYRELKLKIIIEP